MFFDECGVNTDLTRLYGCALGEERAVDKTPFKYAQEYNTILSSIRLNGSAAYTTYSCGTTGENIPSAIQPGFQSNRKNAVKNKSNAS